MIPMKRWIGVVLGLAVVIAWVTAGPVSAGIVQTGLVAHLDAGNADGAGNPGSGTRATWTDLAGGDHNGTLNNFDFTSSSGWVQNNVPDEPAFTYGLQFDGAGDFVAISPTLNLSSTSMTYEFWLRQDTNDTSDGGKNRLIGDYNSSSHTLNNILLRDANGSAAGRVVLSQYLASGGDAETGVGFLTPGEFHQLVVTADASNVIFYLDGGDGPGEKLVFSPTETYAGSSPTTTMIGAMLGHVTVQNFKGQVNIFRAYDRALSDAEVLQNYLATYQVPEPASVVLLAVGIAGLLTGCLRRRRER